MCRKSKGQGQVWQRTARPRNEEILQRVLPTKIGGTLRQRKDGVSHYENSTLAVQRVHTLWPQEEGQYVVEDCIAQHVWKETKQWFQSMKLQKTSQRQARKRRHGGGVEAIAISCDGVAGRTVDAWLDANTQQLNERQRSVLERHVARAREERQEEVEGWQGRRAPLRLLVHGGPGTGKSAVIATLRKFYEEVMQWELGQEVVIASLQASVAAMLQGETLHHVAGINPFHQSGAGGGGPTQAEKVQETTKRLSFLRHLLLDEIFMLSAGLFAEAENHIRQKVPDGSVHKRAADGSVRAWGGINLTMFGDMRQIDPPEGMPLYTVPSSFLLRPRKKALEPLATQGLDLLWNKEAVELVEFKEVYRCVDKWWAEAG